MGLGLLVLGATLAFEVLGAHSRQWH
jgi:hypothetical protein